MREVREAAQEDRRGGDRRLLGNDGTCGRRPSAERDQTMLGITVVALACAFMLIAALAPMWKDLDQ